MVKMRMISPQTAITTPVKRLVSFGLGQLTFFISRMTSAKNPLRPPRDARTLGVGVPAGVRGLLLRGSDLAMGMRCEIPREEGNGATEKDTSDTTGNGRPLPGLSYFFGVREMLSMR